MRQERSNAVRAMSPRRLLPLAGFILLPLLLALRCSLAPETAPLAIAIPLSERARSFERFETAGQVWDDHENPFDPAEVKVDGEFRAPGGEILSTPGFITRPYQRALEGGFERRTAVGPPRWAVRFAPPRPGLWAWRWVVSTPNGTTATPWREVPVDPPAPGRHGFLRVSPRDARYLRFDDGTPYVAIGENTGWYDGRGSYAYDDWFAKLAASGASYARIWMPSWAFGLEWDAALGDYSTRLDRAWQLDQVLEAAERHGIFVMLCLQNHGAFSLEHNSEWAGNPYNAANGGPLAQPEALFSDDTARELFRRRLRYVVARWGWSPNVLAWELWNEVDLVPSSPALVDWHVEMARTLRALDPNDHLITTSLARGDVSPLWNLPEIDLLQMHHYAYPLGVDIPTVLSARMAVQATAHPGKPRLVGEVGSDYRGPGETLQLDPESIGFHQGLWAGLLTGGFGTGMSWWWDNLVDPQDLYFHFRPLAVLVDGIAFDAQSFSAERPLASASGRDLAAYALRGSSVVLAWVQNRAHQWQLYPLPGSDPTPVVGATLALTGVADGPWSVRWIDAYGGEDVAQATISVSGGAVTLAVPVFTRDVALRLERLDARAGSQGYTQ